MGRQRVIEINNGFESVPTLVFADGSTLTEPNNDTLYSRLNTLGLNMEPPALSERIRTALGDPVVSAIGLGFIIGGGFLSSWVIIGVGAVLFLTPISLRIIGKTP